MANQKITELTEETSIADADLVVIVDDVAGTPTTKKMTKGNLFTPLVKIDANTFEQKNSTTAQTFRVYKTTTNNVRLRISNVSNIWEIATESDATPDDFHIVAPSSIRYRFTASTFTVSNSGITLGASGSRWGTIYGAGVDIANAGEFRWASLTRIQPGVDGFPTIRSDAAAASACGWIFGTNDTSGVRLKRNGTMLEAKLGGDSAYTKFMASAFRASEVVADPSAADLTSGANAKDRIEIYMKSDKFVIAYNNAGTVTFITIPLDGSTTTWTHSTTAP